MTPGRLSAQYLAARRDLESFGYGLSGLAAGDGFRHGMRKIMAADRMTTVFLGIRSAHKIPSSNYQVPRKLQFQTSIKASIGVRSVLRIRRWTLNVGRWTFAEHAFV